MNSSTMEQSRRYARHVRALLYIAVTMLIGFAIIAVLYVINPVLGWLGVGFAWWLAFFSDWNLPRRLRKRRPTHSDSK